MLFVISSPSGGGKTTVIKELYRLKADLKFSVSATTRNKRNDEKDNLDYYFISKEEFENKIKKGEFIEWENVHGNYYGTLKSEVEKQKDSNIIFDVDVKGALSIKKIFPEAVIIFLDAPEKEIIERLKQRKTETPEEIKKRLDRMIMECSLKDKFDYVVINESNPGGLEKAVNEILNILNKKITQ